MKTINAYDTYVIDCEEMGFSIDAQKSDTSFYAKYSNGYELTIEYYECNWMHIDLNIPREIAIAERYQEN